MSEALENVGRLICWVKFLASPAGIIFEINDYFLKPCRNSIRTIPICWDRHGGIVDESNGRSVRMAWLAVVVSHKVNGVWNCTLI
ncbi:glycogen/starch/alpha-glucan phosphorylase [Shigella flexneri]